jgi:GNAT superfamily N-acetyltransferase
MTGLEFRKKEQYREREDRKEFQKPLIRLTEKDIDIYYKVLHEGYQSDRPYAVSFAAMDVARADVMQWLRSVPTYGWFQEETLISAISLRMPWGPFPGPKNVPHIGWFVTCPGYQHKGYAGKLLGAVEKEILRKELKAPSVTLGTAESHPWLRSMYEGFGFQAYESVQLPHKKHRTVYMEKVLIHRAVTD